MAICESSCRHSVAHTEYRDTGQILTSDFEAVDEEVAHYCAHLNFTLAGLLRCNSTGSGERDRRTPQAPRANTPTPTT